MKIFDIEYEYVINDYNAVQQYYANFDTIALSDFDNTIVKTNLVYEDAQENLYFSILDILSCEHNIPDIKEYMRNIDQNIAQTHMMHMQYPKILLTQNVIANIQQSGKKYVIIPYVIQQALTEKYEKNTLKHPELYDTVIDGLNLLHDNNIPNIIVTEGKHDRIFNTLKHYNLTKYFKYIIECVKNVETYNSIKNILGNKNSIYMIGDQLSRDIQPANDSGNILTIHVPSEYVINVYTDNVVPHYTVTNYYDATNIVYKYKYF